MLSKKSYFKPALFWDDLRRFSPIWVCASLAMLTLTLNIWLQYQRVMQTPSTGVISTYTYSYNGYSTNTEAAAMLRVDLNEFLLDALAEAGPIAMLLYAVLPAMALLHYLYQSRSVLGVHALPISRTTLFITHYCAGIAMCVLPLAIFCAVTIPVLLVAGAFWPGVLLTFCGGILGLYLFFFSFAMFCGMFTGQLWGLPVFYGIFNGLAPLTFTFFVMLAQQFLFGFSTNNLNLSVVRHLTPVWQFFESLRCENITSADTFRFLGLGCIACYAAVGLLLAAAAYAIFCRRHLERAGEIVSVNILRPIFTICLGVYGGFCAMMLYCYLFNASQDGWMFFFLVLGSLFGTAVGRMLLEKSLAIFTLRNLKQMLLVVLFSCLCLASIRFDLLGYQDYIPAADEIESVSISATLYADPLRISLYNGGSYAATTDADIALMRDAHAAFLADHRALLTAEQAGALTPEAAQEEFIYFQDGVRVDSTEATTALTTATCDGTDPIFGEYTYYHHTTPIDLEYTLTTGQTITRSYYLEISTAELARAGSPISHLEPFVNGIDLASLLGDLRNTSTVSMYRYGQNGESTYDDGDAGSQTASGAIDAVIADIQANGITASLLEKQYLVGEAGEFYFSVYSPEASAPKENLYDAYYGSMRMNVYPGTNAQDYLFERVTPDEA